MAFSKSGLTDLQKEVLAIFFAREDGFFLTGGAALVGYLLGHRFTHDLDLFTLDEAAFERGPFVLRSVADSLGAELAVRQEAPGFRRYLVSRQDEGVLVDLVLERVPQIYGEKLEREGVLVDPPEEILANKLNTLVSRSEERDLVDLMLLEKAGFAAEQGLAAALHKDAGCTPANLAWILSQIKIPDGATLPAGVEPAELRSYLEDLLRRLRRAAIPSE